MSKSFTLQAEVRNDQGKGASRRLRQGNKVPAVIYGAGQAAQSISLKHNELLRNLQDEAFYSQIIAVDFGDRKERVILRDLQRHPSRPVIMHADLLRIQEDHVLQVHIPLHFLNEENSVGVKTQGGTVSRITNEVEVSCLPKDIPEYIEVDMVNVEKGQIVHLSDLKLPAGVSLPALALGEDHNLAIAAIH
ncbi:50S ribosomal protein L25/general stress protein Ctc [Thiolinea disciformis]|uniref:50S ribosomal protein L25/general stress protein Ctc n=1 Tax=Thiolinea disciformis TaxID=125614 RepID=UPI000382DF07|nr:50S ribosomal protein L25/general stress protein Ctc [Thiolinea disciformis]